MLHALRWGDRDTGEIRGGRGVFSLAGEFTPNCSQEKKKLRGVSTFLMTQHMCDKDDHVLLPSSSCRRTCAPCTDNFSGSLLSFKGSFKKLLSSTRPRLDCQVFVMEEGIDNPVFTTLGEVDLKSIDKEISKVKDGEKEDSHAYHTDEEFKEGPCGWGKFTPSFLQCCNNPKGYLVMYSLLAIMQGKQYGNDIPFNNYS